MFAKVSELKKDRNNRSVAKVGVVNSQENYIEINAEIGKHKRRKNSKHQKERKFNNELEYGISDYYDYY